jgi:hypothetical protein
MKCKTAPRGRFFYVAQDAFCDVSVLQEDRLKILIEGVLLLIAHGIAGALHPAQRYSPLSDVAT